MKWQVLFLALCCASVQALHVTRPLVTPFKQMLKQGADGRLRAEGQGLSPYEGVHSGCYHPMESPRMPKSVFQCAGSKEATEAAQKALQRAKPAGDNPTDPCEGKDQAACHALDECTWCKSAAVPSSCYTRAQAKFLPPAVFQCDKPAPTVSARRGRRKATLKAALAAGRFKRRSAAPGSRPIDA
ncbi:hypothetical protein COO60DRAFT_1485523 [Scenedesmus sp. NREL 46B-D3]|nr:hypothetical protein COO60DRAFT_1485523 [Scenedesmus sp. NREL 46B-D3]